MDSARSTHTPPAAIPQAAPQMGDGTLSRPAVLAELERMLLVDLRLGLEAEALNPDAPLLEDGLGLDSITLFELITLVERRYGLSFPPEKMSSETFTSLNAMAGIVVELVTGNAS